MQVALANWQRPRLGVFRDRFFVAVTVPHGDLATQRVLASELDLFVGRNYLVSAHKRPLPFAERVLARATQNPALLKLDSAFLLSILVDELLAHYEVLTEELEDEVEAMEVRALTDASDALLEDLLHLKRFVFAVYRLAGQHRATLEAFLRPDFPLVGGDIIEPYFRDLDERLGRLLDALEAAKESVNGAFDLYVSQVAHRTNDIMKVLTIVFGHSAAGIGHPWLLRHRLRVPAAQHNHRVHRHDCPHHADHGEIAFPVRPSRLAWWFGGRTTHVHHSATQRWRMSPDLP